LNPKRYVPFWAKYSNAELGTGSAPVGFALFMNLRVAGICQMGGCEGMRGKGDRLVEKDGTFGMVPVA
jgi:hypothetical protein